ALPGDQVEVRLAVENRTDRVLTDVRVVDGVPDSLTVVEGSPRGALTLTPGEERRIQYTVIAIRGTHPFGSPAVSVHDLPSTRSQSASLELTGDTTLTCRFDVDDIELPTQTMQHVGEVPTEQGGAGIEFHATREYRPGDSQHRIHWRQLAKRDELVTVDYREHRAAKVVLVVDGRRHNWRTSAPGLPHGVELASYAAMQAFKALTHAGHIAGLATIQPGSSGGKRSGGIDWVPAGRGPETENQIDDAIQRLLDAPPGGDEDGEEEPPWRRGQRGDDEAERRPPSAVADGGTRDVPWIIEHDEQGASGSSDRGKRLGRALETRLDADAQVMVFSPLLDEVPTRIVERLVAYRHEATVVSPNVTAGGRSPGEVVAGIERQLRLQECRQGGARTIDWSRGTPLSLAMSTALEPYL
ncbi:MAG: DUF58 domain-containing protein, partial [Halodesulfurarchaeum sp.]